MANSVKQVSVEALMMLCRKGRRRFGTVSYRTSFLALLWVCVGVLVTYSSILSVSVSTVVVGVRCIYVSVRIVSVVSVFVSSVRFSVDIVTCERLSLALVVRARATLIVIVMMSYSTASVVSYPLIMIVVLSLLDVSSYGSECVWILFVTVCTVISGVVMSRSEVILVRKGVMMRLLILGVLGCVVSWLVILS